MRYLKVFAHIFIQKNTFFIMTFNFGLKSPAVILYLQTRTQYKLISVLKDVRLLG